MLFSEKNYWRWTNCLTAQLINQSDPTGPVFSHPSTCKSPLILALLLHHWNGPSSWKEGLSSTGGLWSTSWGTSVDCKNQNNWKWTHFCQTITMFSGPLEVKATHVSSELVLYLCSWVEVLIRQAVRRIWPGYESQKAGTKDQSHMFST